MVTCAPGTGEPTVELTVPETWPVACACAIRTGTASATMANNGPRIHASRAALDEPLALGECRSGFLKVLPSAVSGKECPPREASDGCDGGRERRRMLS